MNRSALRFFYFLCLVSALSGCNYTIVKNPGADDNNTAFELPNDQLSILSYQLIKEKVFTPKCLSCHGTSGGVDLNTYNSTKDSIGKVQSAVFDLKTMPKNGTLTQEQKALLWNWIKIGAPEFAQGETPQPQPTPEPLEPTFTSIDKNILQVTCINCHNPTGSGKRIPLDKQSLLNSPLELVLPYNPDESSLVIAVERMDEKRMPLASEGYSRLKNEEILAIRNWINNGAKD